MAAEYTHILEASATPIPHAIASTLYAGIDVLRLHTSPVSRNIVSSLEDGASHKRISADIKETIAQGHKVAIIYPRVNAQSDVSVERAAVEIETAMPGTVAMVHGKLPEQQIRETLDAFRRGDKKILVASSIVETGIDVPDIRLMVVRDAERFGAAQLHQLRGRLARNGGSAKFIMMIDSIHGAQEFTLQRLKAVRDISDGFKLAEEDMVIRGFGDLLGEQQNGAIGLPMRLLDLSVPQVQKELESFHEQMQRMAENSMESAL